MDINSFSLDTEYFGFNHYKRSAKSNLDFMYFTRIEDTAEYKKALRDYNEAVENINESNLPQAEKDKRLKDEEQKFNTAKLKLRGTQIVEGAGKAASKIDDLFTKATSALGIKTTTDTRSTQNAPINVSYKEEDKDMTINKNYLIIGGLLLATGIGFWIYKNR